MEGERRITEVWERYLNSGQEWLVSYICAPGFLESVKLFSVGHAFELHLKAVHVKVLRDEKKCLSIGHNIMALWDQIKAADPKFLPSVALRKSILSANILEHGLVASAFKDDWDHFVKYRELYMVAKHMAELKYLGTPLRKPTAQLGYSWTFPNEMWLQIFEQIRRYLGATQGNILLERLKEGGEVSPYSLRLLERTLVE